jgi:hypothetical protein
MAWRSRRHHLDRRAPREELLGVASRIGGLHAQLMSSAELTLWARVEGLKAEDVASALWPQRTLFKTWAMHGTLHLLPTSGAFRDRIYPPQGWISPVLLVDGRLDGTWGHERKGGRVEVRIAPFVKVSTAVKKAAAEDAERLAEFVGGRLDLGWVA